MLKQNIGTINALTRITLGLFFIVYGAVKIIRKPWRQGYWIVVLAAAMKVGEGIVRYCPMTEMVKNKLINTFFKSNAKSRSERDDDGENHH